MTSSRINTVQKAERRLTYYIVTPLFKTFALKSKDGHPVQEIMYNCQLPLPDKRKVKTTYITSPLKASNDRTNLDRDH